MTSKRAAAAALGLCLAFAPLVRADLPKNVILFVGDGMGIEQIKAAGYYFNGAAGQFNFEQFTDRAWMTHNNSAGGVTDSAASGTALATGYKVDNGVISVARASGLDPRSATPSDDRELLTLLESLTAAGKSSGLVTTSYMTDATPAAFAAHNISRSNNADIASDYFSQTRPNVLFGGGQTGFTSADAASAGYTVATSRTQLQGINTASTTHAAGIFGTGGFAYAYDQSVGASTFYNSNPYLEEMTQTALDILDNDTDGFFLMVENELTDSSGHQPVGTAGKIERNMFEVRELARAVQKAIDFAAAHPDTLILVTSDHETGSFTADANNGAGVLPTVVSGSAGHNATWVPVYAIGPNAGHVTGHLDNTGIVNVVTSADPEPMAASVVTFRQDENGYTATRDTQVRFDQPNGTFGSDARLVVDQDDNTLAGSQPVQSVIRFDGLFGSLAVPEGSEIRSARLTLHTGNAGNDDTGDTLAIHRLLAGFSEATTTWNNAGNVANNGFSLNGAGAADDDYLVAAESLFPSPDDNALVMFDVTATLQTWLADPAANFGWLILSNGTNGWRWDSSEGATAVLRPMLEVTFVPEPGAISVLVIAAIGISKRRRHHR